MKRHSQAILFDLDDTLYDEMTFVVSGFQAVAAHLAEQHNLDAAQLSQEIIELLAEQGRGRIFDDALQRYNLYSPERVQTLVRVYRTHQPRLEVYPDVIPVLSTLKAQGYRLGLITDGLYTVQRRKIEALGIKTWFDLIICTDELGPDYWKPHPRAFEQMLTRFQIPPEQAMYVGNDPGKDFIAPNQLGMGAVQIRRPDKTTPWSPQAEVHIHDLYQLMDILKE